MKATINLVLIAFAAIFSSCGPIPTNDDNTLNAETFDRVIRESNDEIILDVRTPEEFVAGHIPDAVLMNVKDANFKAKIKTLDKSSKILVYCAAGPRSEKAADILRDAGFKKVHQLADGLKSWNEAQKELTK